ncbi:LytTR family DNA-binding domain-containing protein [Lysinibacillus sp. BW-2-10]|uniref:LytTR family DNA-binding domain-containing protein n=1 Tax=Lysinibacillus sp. BW-2-10 TaxID=2590030 RepID=UPI00117D22D8|nr:LytTR family DNA-binding domain-containing protein [Lysinibacillus sp. BW-2-10]TSI02530.1 LytTR family transcriptional regulator [Lysinibacillus sp. BW-2-10]
MKVSIEEIDRDQEEEILIRCYEVTHEIHEIVNTIHMDNPILPGYLNDTIHRVKLSDIYYFEAVDGKVFFYCKDQVFEVKQKLYELETMCSKKCFRASKSTIINIAKISTIYPTISGRFEAILDNNERLVISRQYVPVLKEKLGL